MTLKKSEAIQFNRRADNLLCKRYYPAVSTKAEAFSAKAKDIIIILTLLLIEKIAISLEKNK